LLGCDGVKRDGLEIDAFGRKPAENADNPPFLRAVADKFDFEGRDPREKSFY